MIIGITGKSGSGKSTYAQQLAEENGFRVVNIDKISHAIMTLPAIKAKLIAIFGHEVIKDGEIDRKYIGDLIFTNRHLYKAMSALIWDMMKFRIDHIVSTNKNIILDWILLPHTHYWKMCDKKILMVADEEDRKNRVMARDNISVEYLNKRDAAGINYDDIEFDQIIYTTKEEHQNGKTI
jgi:dephospho-CoA kinase